MTDWRPRFISSRTPAARRRVYLAATVYFMGVSAAMIWPLYTLASRIEPTVLGLPLSLAYLTALVILSFIVALALYRWEDRQGVLDGADEAPHDELSDRQSRESAAADGRAGERGDHRRGDTGSRSSD